MIVTRRRQRRPSSGRFIVPLLALAALAFAFAWPPSQRVIANGPLKPVWNAGADAGAVVTRPLSFAGQQQAIADRNREIRDLDVRLDQERRAKADAEARAQALQQHLTALANQPPPAVAAPPHPVPTAAAAGAAAAFAGAAPANGETRRLAATWAAMEPEQAAAVVQRLPDDQVSRVLGQMDADSAGAILNALPPGIAARISRGIAGLAGSGGAAVGPIDRRERR
jgi:flagellar motility protein MotE (MotC chaperone)